MIGYGVRERAGHPCVRLGAQCAHGLAQLCHIELERDEDYRPNPQCKTERVIADIEHRYRTNDEKKCGEKLEQNGIEDDLERAREFAHSMGEGAGKTRNE